MKWEAELHLPAHSADGYWRVIDAESDNGDVIAIVDPDNIVEGLGKEPKEYARLIAAAPTLEAFRAKVASMLPYCYEDGCENDEEHTHGGETPDGSWTDQQAEDAIATLNALIEEARAIAKAEGGA